jgi:hypothetical protein
MHMTRGRGTADTGDHELNFKKNTEGGLQMVIPWNEDDIGDLSGQLVQERFENAQQYGNAAYATARTVMTRRACLKARAVLPRPVTATTTTTAHKEVRNGR